MKELDIVLVKSLGKLGTIVHEYKDGVAYEVEVTEDVVSASDTHTCYKEDLQAIIPDDRYHIKGVEMVPLSKVYELLDTVLNK